jgi:hypothetical protein
MWIGWLTTALEEAVTLPIGDEALPPEPSACRLLAAAPEQEAVRAVLGAAREALLLTAQSGPPPDQALSPDGEYVYAYFADPDRPVWDGCFY